MEPPDDERVERLQKLEDFILSNKSELNVDGLLDCIQAIYTDCDYPTLRGLKCIETFIQRCKFEGKCLLKTFNSISNFLDGCCGLLDKLELSNLMCASERTPTHFTLSNAC